MPINDTSTGKLLYPIGEAAKIAQVSRKALRFYDSIGLLSPDKIGDNEYRYYSMDSLLVIPVIKYYKQMGFHIDEMRNLINGASCRDVSGIFLEKLEERTHELEHIEHQYTSIKDWNSMIVEAASVRGHNATEVSLRYYDKVELLYYEQDYKADYRDAIINIEFTNFVSSLDNKITGPVIRYFDSIKNRRNNCIQSQTILQNYIKPCIDTESLREFGGSMMLSCYHLGSHDTIFDTYDRMLNWAKKHSHNCDAGMYERYLIDYWLTNDESQFVTEIIIEIDC